MNSLYKLLEDKNYWYRKYLASNDAYIAALKHDPETAVEELDFFFGNRESLIKILEDLDKRISADLAHRNLTPDDLNSEQKTKIQFFSREKDSLVARIVEQDQIIIEGIEALKSAGLEKLKLLSKGKNALSRYKSGTGRSEKLDKRI